MNESEETINHDEKLPRAKPGFLRTLVRLILVLLVGLFLGISLYYLGSVYIYWKAIQPAQSSVSKLTILETSIAGEQKHSEDRLSQFNQRLTELEKQHTLDAETLAELQSGMSSMNEVVDDLTANLDRLDDLTTDMEKLNERTKKNEENLAGLQQTLILEDTPLANLSRELKILKAMELISRSRLYLIQNNPGLARADIEAAIQTLTDITENAPVDQKKVITLWLQRLDLALKNVNEVPVVAANDLEIAWSQMAAGFSTPLQMATIPAAALTATGTPEVSEMAATPSPATPTLQP